MKKTFYTFQLVTLLLLSFGTVSAQVIWSENFTYANGTTTGANNNTANPAADWTSTCPTCLSGDHFHVQTGRMEGQDTNGPATLTSEVIDISSALGGVEFSVDLSESGTMEGCTGGCGCNCIDWIRIEISVNGGGFTDLSHANGGACANACSGNTYVTIDDFAAFTFTECPIVGNTMQFRISVQEWAGTEFHRIDNIVIQAQTCILPVEFASDLEGKALEDEVELTWATAVEKNNDKFVIERSSDPAFGFVAIGEVNSQLNSDQRTDYNFTDENPLRSVAYYRLRQTDLNGSISYSNTVQVFPNGLLEVSSVYPNPASDVLNIDVVATEGTEVLIYDIMGKVLVKESIASTDSKVTTSMNISHLPVGTYLYKIVDSKGSVYNGRFYKK